MNILDRQFLGSGSHWTVFALTLAHPGYAIRGKCHVEVAQKIGGPLKENLENYQKCKSAGISTLEFFEAAEIDEEPCILCENISLRKRLYVSPNTARHLPSAELFLIEALENNYTKNAARKHRRRSLAEYSLWKNKLKKVLHLEDLIQQMEDETIKAANARMILCEDMFFFGTNRNAETSLDILVADFDTVCNSNEDDETGEYALINMQMGLTAIWEFFEYFVEAGTHRAECQDLLDARKEKCVTALELLDERR